MCQVWLIFGPVVLEKKIFNFINVFSLFRNYLPLEKGVVLHLNKLESFSSKETLCQVWLKLAQWFFRRRFFYFVSLYFGYFLIISPWKSAWPFILTNLNLPYPRMLCASFGWNWSGCSGEEDFQFFVNVFSLFRNYLPFEKGVTLHLNKLVYPLPKDTLCQVCLKLALCFWRIRFLNTSMYFHYFVIISPWKRAWPFIWTNLNLLYPRIFCAKFGWN